MNNFEEDNKMIDDILNHFNKKIEKLFTDEQLRVARIHNIYKDVLIAILVLFIFWHTFYAQNTQKYKVEGSIIEPKKKVVLNPWHQ